VGAALQLLRGVVHRRKSAANTLAALKSIRRASPDGAPIYVILDNLSARKQDDPRLGGPQQGRAVFHPEAIGSPPRGARDGYDAVTEPWAGNLWLCEHTQAAYRRDVTGYLDWCTAGGIRPRHREVPHTNGRDQLSTPPIRGDLADCRQYRTVHM